jgi:signal peptidase I
MKFYKSEKFQKIFYPIVYLAFTIAITISGCYIFERNYYTNIFVSGPSMNPTLVGVGEDEAPINIHHYGIADTTEAAINSLKRFDVLITHYPETWHSDGLIVKRVWAFPGETISLISNDQSSTFTVKDSEDEIKYTITATKVNKEVDLIYSKVTMDLYEFNTGRKVFFTNAGTKRSLSNYTLGNNEYFVMGDNWSSSTDCYTKKDDSNRLTKNYLQGKVICIQGYGKIATNGSEFQIFDKVKIRPMYNF